MSLQPAVPFHEQAAALVSEMSSKGHSALASRRPKVTGHENPDFVTELPVDPGPERSRIENVMGKTSREEFERQKRMAANYMTTAVEHLRANTPRMVADAAAKAGLKSNPTAPTPTAADPVAVLLAALEKLDGRKTLRVAQLLALLKNPDAALPTPKKRRRRVA